DLVALRERVTVSPTAPGPGSVVEVTLKDGRTVMREVDVAVPARDLPAQQAKLERKFRHLTTGALGEAGAEAAIEVVRGLEREPDLSRLLRAVSPGLAA